MRAAVMADMAAVWTACTKLLFAGKKCGAPESCFAPGFCCFMGVFLRGLGEKWVLDRGFLWWSCGELGGEMWWMDGGFSGAENMPLDLNFLVEISK
jgi:hypothetical protein